MLFPGANPLQTKPMWNISHRDMPAFTKAGLISGTKSESSNLLSNTVQIA